MYQFNVDSKENYQGQNQADLLNAKNKHQYHSDMWGTYLQWKANGRNVKKGETSKVSIFLGFGDFTVTKTDKDGKEKTANVSKPLGFKAVFNYDQTEILDKRVK